MKINMFDVVLAIVVGGVVSSIIVTHKPKSKPITESTFTNATEVVGPKLPKLIDDFVMGSVTAVSNAVLVGAPPSGWRVACSPDGFYAAITPDGRIMDNDAYKIRTNRFQAMVVAWRMKEIWESPRPEYRLPEYGVAKKWQPCDN